MPSRFLGTPTLCIDYLSNPEVEHDGHEDIDWTAREPAGLESPLAGGLDG